VAAAGLESGRPLDVCKPHITDDRPTPLPAWLVSRAKHLFQIDMPDGLIQKTTVYRCLNGKTLLCMAGANLACGKANTNRDLPSVADWCRDHTESDSVPMFVTGHDTVYRWHCSGGRPGIDATAETVDARGFIARNWKDAGLN
jgi:hypothetical protein